MKWKKSLYKKCPRCGNRCLANQARCEECDLIFARLEYASNKAAKRQLLKFDRDYIIYTKQLPKDVSRIKLYLYTFLLGLFGGQYYYVGKYIKGLLMTLGFAYVIICTILNPYMAEYMEANLLYVPIGIYAISWIISIVYVISNKFKVPVIVEMPKEEVVE